MEKIDFPSVTICPQGTAKEMVDAVLFKQFDHYLQSKNTIMSELTPPELVQEGHAFLEDVYPGINMPPNKMVSMMASPGADVEKIAKAAAIFNPEPTNPCPTESNNGGNKRKKRYNPDPNALNCPDGWEFNQYGSCYYYHTAGMTFNQAESYCNAKGSGSTIVEIESTASNNLQDYLTLYQKLKLTGRLTF